MGENSPEQFKESSLRPFCDEHQCFTDPVQNTTVVTLCGRIKQHFSTAVYSVLL